MAIDIVSKSIVRQTICSSKQLSKVDIKNGVIKCPNAEKKIKIIKAGFYNEKNEKIDGIDKSQKVLFIITGENLGGRTLMVDLSNHKDIMFKMAGTEISLEESLVLDMNGNEMTIELFAELVEK